MLLLLPLLFLGQPLHALAPASLTSSLHVYWCAGHIKGQELQSYNLCSKHKSSVCDSLMMVTIVGALQWHAQHDTGSNVLCMNATLHLCSQLIQPFRLLLLFM